MASSEIEPASAAASVGQPGHAAAGGPAEPSCAPQVQQRSLLQRAFREGVVITVLVAAIIAALNVFWLIPNDPARVRWLARQRMPCMPLSTRIMRVLTLLHSVLSKTGLPGCSKNSSCYAAAADVYSRPACTLHWRWSSHAQ